MKTYTIDGTEYSQGRLSVASLLRLARLFASRAAGGGFELSLDGVIAALEDPEVLPEFLATVFRVERIGFDALNGDHAETIMEVVTDFLGLNSGIVPKLTALLNATASLNGKAQLETLSAS